MVRFALVTIALAAAGCDGGTVDLAIDLRTDFVAGTELGRVETSLDGTVIGAVAPAGSLIDGARVALAEGIEPSNVRTVRVVLYDLAGVALAERSAVVNNSVARAVTLVITRACRSVTCGGADETCVDGECRALGCLEGNEPECGVPACASASDCTMMVVPCATVSCVTGVCLEEPGTCGATGQTCDLDLGCVGGERDAGIDAGARDAGFDAGPDASACADCTGGCGCLGGGDCCFTCSGVCGGACGSGNCGFYFAGSASASVNCSGTAVCTIDLNGSTGGDIGCTRGATCDVDCSASDGCDVECTTGSRCLLHCAGATACDLAPCDAPGGVVDCGGGVLVCGRPCP